MSPFFNLDLEKKTDWYIFAKTKSKTMEITTGFYTKSEIINEWKKAQKSVSEHLQKSDSENFHLIKNDKWSQAQNLDHLIRSTKPIVKVLGLGRMGLLALGKAKNPSRPYEEIKEVYLEGLKNLTIAQGVFGPDADEISDKTDLINFWNSVGDRLTERLEKKDEKFLDKYTVPHPLLGKMTIREILFFTVYHTYHHLKAIKKIG